MSSIEQEANKLLIPFQELSDATNAFSEHNLIARGGYGKVYKGESVKHGKIAVKTLDPRQDPRLAQGDPQFRTEIALLSVYKHENIVSLLGFCDEDGHKILVYKYESNGSLNTHLSSTDLTWIQRLQICLDAARGLEYLHGDVGSEDRILHCDVKSANILLDDNWKAKVSDFGLSKVGPANAQTTFLICKPCGTYGYIDPDFGTTGYLTQKSDVYSFGVVLFEVLCGRLTRILSYTDKRREFLMNLVRIHWKRNTIDEIVFSGLQGQINRASLLTFTTIAYQCLMSGNERPTMKQVVEQLQKALDNQLAPSGSWSDGDDFAIEDQAQSAGLSLSVSDPVSSSQAWKYDVFISFRGEDTRKKFVDHLYSNLEDRQIITYRDDELIIRVATLPESLVKAIEESCIAIIVFSRHYADSSWCLEELALIMRNKDLRGQIVIPVYYDVDPSEVRNQTSDYGEAFARHDKLENNNKVQYWRKALKDAAGLAGWDTRNGHESKVIRQICDHVSSRLLSLMPPSEPTAKASAKSPKTDLIGIETRMEQFKSRLQVVGSKSRPTMKQAPRGTWSDGDDFAADDQAWCAGSSLSLSGHVSSSHSWKYDVFISSGEDTRKTFVDHLYSNLEDRQIITYRDDEQLQKGMSIHQFEYKAIEESRIAIVVFSPTYARSSWCLDELELIMNCRHMRGHTVIPIFYDVEPSEVRNLKNDFGKAFARHERRNNNKVASWRNALKEAASLAGWDIRHISDGHESKVIRHICDHISNNLLYLMPPSDPSAESSAKTNLIGIETRLEQLKSSLQAVALRSRLQAASVSMVGICGMRGSGKSTLASSIYDEISHEFEGSCFIKNVRAESRMHGLKTLQEKILSNVLKSKVALKSIEHGISMMTKRLSLNSVLIVLDDVDHIDHLKMLAGSENWFGKGSLVIFTTRNQDLVNACGGIIHNVPMLDDTEAIELFKRHAFGESKPVQGFEEIALNMVPRFGGHPSALISVGSFLHGKGMSDWISMLDRLVGRPVDEILKEFETPDDGVDREIIPRFLT